METRRVKHHQLSLPEENENVEMDKQIGQHGTEENLDDDSLTGLETLYPPMIKRCIIVLSLMLATFLVFDLRFL